MAVAMLLVTLLFIALSSTAPTKIVGDKTPDLSYQALAVIEQLCKDQFCLLGKATFNLDTYSCECPDWQDHYLFNSPCADLECTGDEEPFYSIIDDACNCKSIKEWYKLQDDIADTHTAPDMERVVDLKRRQAPPMPEPAVDSAVPTYIPPPKQGITPALLNESLTIQPQNTATVASIIPYFRDNVLQVHLQLNGPVADTLVLNASTALPCGNIGLDPEPNIALVPQVVQQCQGQPQVVADCLCIAVNMYTPDVITYWIQNVDGSVYSLTGSSKVIDMNKMNTTQSVALSLVTWPLAASQCSSEAMFQGESQFDPDLVGTEGNST
ncbi:hypothetical protein A1O3_02124 [Capronia epimyces CBS 606.96]|uniref:Extracellular membrane protein CFEM domain-containing protein n=1 Tax=Capronia epimyces CBS 606.96 TaxID=1182542 RepID=W9YHC2_9EURO|nr:uncharacterized protein A1O3_02124 [Capronia epimyces CBS 606.96]EXJ89060.1 hypothetical protein A1O3_02124 [Capronia epimyces CBS 606.96]